MHAYMHIETYTHTYVGTYAHPYILTSLHRRGNLQSLESDFFEVTFRFLGFQDTATMALRSVSLYICISRPTHPGT